MRDGFTGHIFATRGTIDLCSYLLPYAGSIQESEARMLNSRNTRRGRPEVAPIYTAADAIETLNAFRPVDYETQISVGPGIRARYWNAGHLIGFNRNRMCEQDVYTFRSTSSRRGPVALILAVDAEIGPRETISKCGGRRIEKRIKINSLREPH